MLKSFEKFEFCPCEVLDAHLTENTLRPDYSPQTVFCTESIQREFRAEQSAHRLDMRDPMDAASRMFDLMTETGLSLM